VRFAVATDDGQLVAAHTGRCAGFVIFDATGGVPARVELRTNTFTAHARGQCGGAKSDASGAGHGSHAGIVEALRDCEGLVTRGLGPRLLADLAAHGIQVYFCDCQSVDEAAALFVAGRLSRASACAHRCH
jgi:predicted Fe-Mo cluster-binding NifX family protein